MASTHSSVGLLGIFLLSTIVSPWAKSTNSMPSLPPPPPAGSPTKLVSYPPPPKLPAANSSKKLPSINDLNWDDESSKSFATAVEFNVLNYGAVGNGKTNDVQAFQDAWRAACAVEGGYVHAPAGYNFKVYPVIFTGPCKTNMTFEVDGTLMAPKAPSVWDNYGNYWLKFQKVSMTLQGQGTIDGQGQTWWADSCKANSTNPCVDGPTAVVFDSCTNVSVKNVAILNSQQVHLTFERSSGILVTNVTITAPGTSPNTDGIHLQNSSYVTIMDTVIGTVCDERSRASKIFGYRVSDQEQNRGFAGDDCISVQTGSFNVYIKNVACGPGHGISVGGLGESQSRAEVSGLVVDTAVFNGPENGVRIKSWQGSSGYANNILFQNIKMINTQNPILIDQYYCDSAPSGSCKNYTSNVVISNITYRNITGTSDTNAAVSFHCSETVACTGINLYDIDMIQTSGYAATSSCVDAFGLSAGTLNPASCLAI